MYLYCRFSRLSRLILELVASELLSKYKDNQEGLDELNKAPKQIPCPGCRIDSGNLVNHASPYYLHIIDDRSKEVSHHYAHYSALNQNNKYYLVL